MKRILAICLVFCGVSGAAAADTLADMRQDLASLLVEIHHLDRELSATQAAGFVHAGSLLDRTNVIELELQRLTAKAEELTFRVTTIVRDATARVADLEACICALEPGCVMGEVGSTLPLGDIDGDIPAEYDPMEGVILTVTEQKDLDAAKQAFAEGDVATAIVLFTEFLTTYPVGPFTQLAHLELGHAHLEAADYKLAAREYLEAFSVNETTALAPNALYSLAIAFHKMGKTDEGCLTLQEVQFRFEGEEAANDAMDAAVTLNCA
ncbi:MAG: tol-pal system protein [Planktomarina sp.]